MFYDSWIVKERTFSISTRVSLMSRGAYGWLFYVGRLVRSVTCFVPDVVSHYCCSLGFVLQTERCYGTMRFTIQRVGVFGFRLCSCASIVPTWFCIATCTFDSIDLEPRACVVTSRLCGCSLLAGPFVRRVFVGVVIQCLYCVYFNSVSDSSIARSLSVFRRCLSCSVFGVAMRRTCSSLRRGFVFFRVSVASHVLFRFEIGRIF